MKSIGAIFGVLLIWYSSLQWCYEYWHKWYPSGVYFYFVPIGVYLVFRACHLTSSWKPFWISLIALIPPLVALACRGFNI
ncbi:hypothetical protein Pla144_28020 [Bythopirellula polymerisocia]|uniref:Uncharacterized protein n=1 Tax=Bythopirellula polymerisocia TaxID=2528003 RepID=A0A5C6CNB8_9BACT|nr:hypothetical protein Pla144_28020 [Bythopirellula polymerisocia]